MASTISVHALNHLKFSVHDRNILAISVMEWNKNEQKVHKEMRNEKKSGAGGIWLYVRFTSYVERYNDTLVQWELEVLIQWIYHKRCLPWVFLDLPRLFFGVSCNYGFSTPGVFSNFWFFCVSFLICCHFV
jgi:hypothetical protein